MNLCLPSPIVCLTSTQSCYYLHRVYRGRFVIPASLVSVTADVADGVGVWIRDRVRTMWVLDKSVPLFNERIYRRPSLISRSSTLWMSSMPKSVGSCHHCGHQTLYQWNMEYRSGLRDLFLTTSRSESSPYSHFVSFVRLSMF